MIAHRTVESLLDRYGETAQGRKKAREAIRQDILSAAADQVGVAGRSIRCRRGDHHDGPAGCRNSGRGCICECHDPVPSGISVEETDRP